MHWLLKFSDSWWTTFRLGFTTIMKQVGCHSPRASPWGCTAVCGMQMTGPPRVGVWRPIGPRLHSWLITEILTLMLTLHLQTPSAMEPGRIRDSMLVEGTGWDGYSRSIWFITTALIPSGFLMAHLQNARNPDFEEAGYLMPWLCFWISFLHAFWILKFE